MSSRRKKAAAKVRKAVRKAREKRIREWVRKHSDRHLCKCGCEGIIAVTETHYKNGKTVPNYLPGHNLKDADINYSEIRSNFWSSLSEEEKSARLKNLKKFEKGEHNPNWKGGWFLDSSGYIRVLIDNHPFSINGYCLEHRVVVENWLRKNNSESDALIKKGDDLFLKQKYVIHHIDEVKTNNNINNLTVFRNQAEHLFWHTSKLSESEKIKKIENGDFICTKP
jgi:hypothetical protein